MSTPTLPNDRVYSTSHEWHKVEGDTLTLGLTRFAVDQLTDVTFVQMKSPGHKFSAGDSIGEVESVKTTSDIYCACPGEVVAVNSAVVEDPSLVNSDPYGAGWLVKIRPSDTSGLSSLMDAQTYGKQYS
ncbi:MAG: glycine cleavage system protein GcvH [Phycisphaeraceae bacterium]|nr:glycine cleavage system protein GcvH [Phycisphaeraceae bacterium]